MVDESLERDVQAAFGEQWQAALEQLDIYGREPYEREPERVRRAVLKLAEGDLKQLQHITERACQDYRDVLMWAEYPEASKDVTEADVRALLEKWGRSEPG